MQGGGLFEGRGYDPQLLLDGAVSVTMLHKLVEILLDMDGRDLVDGHGSNRETEKDT